MVTMVNHVVVGKDFFLKRIGASVSYCTVEKSFAFMVNRANGS